MGAFQWTPHRVLLFSYLIAILVGSILLYLPISTTRTLSYLDALFTSTSAITVTGLVVLDTEKDFTPFGKVVLLVLIQLGGLGYMTLTTYFLITLRRKIGLRERLILAEAFNYPGMYGLVRFTKRMLPIILFLEFLGAVLLFPSFFQRQGDPLTSAGMSLFHSISAFNNAGFSLFSDNLTRFRGDIWLNLVVCTLIILGGLGFFVLYELLLYWRGGIRRLSTHTKLVLVSSSLLVLLGSFVLLLDLYQWDELSLKEKILVSLFHSVSARTAGFNTVDLSMLSEASLFMLINLMFVGASPGGTGGGIKTITATVIFLAVLSHIRGQREVSFLGRRLMDSQIHRAMVILSLGFAYTTLMALILSEIEGKRLIPVLFEVVSAFSTVGLSVGNPQGLSLSADFSPLGKILIILTMITGRVGVLSFMLALAGKGRVRHVSYPEARLLL
ncbi:MAG: potassium transporter [Acidobacteria bacterium]|jgi:trk system potassium uptake protein TrkH|nr:MAG: potassium transporter [Acidobacteriota bacterium]